MKIVDKIFEKVANAVANKIEIKKPQRKPSVLMDILNDPDNCNMNISVEEGEIVIRIKRKETPEEA